MESGRTQPGLPPSSPVQPAASAVNVPGASARAATPRLHLPRHRGTRRHATNSGATRREARTSIAASVLPRIELVVLRPTFGRSQVGVSGPSSPLPYATRIRALRLVVGALVGQGAPPDALHPLRVDYLHVGEAVPLARTILRPLREVARTREPAGNRTRLTRQMVDEVSVAGVHDRFRSAGPGTLLPEPSGCRRDAEPRRSRHRKR